MIRDLDALREHREEIPPDVIPLSTKDIAQILGVPTGTLYRWAHEDQWTRYGVRNRRRWDFNEAQASHDRRRHTGPT